MSKTITLAVSILAATITFAQSDTMQGKIPDPLIVTANKYPQKQSTTGKVITVITKEQLEKSAGKTVAQVLNEQAGLVVNGAYNNAGSVQTVYMRGASSGRTLILMDGIPVSDPSMINNEFDVNLFSLDNVERIEICKGAQSTLYGSDAIAGVVNIITIKQNIQKPVNVQATVSAGNYGTLKSNLQLYGKKNKLTYTARYARLHTGGFSSAYDSTGKNNFDNDSYDGDVLNGQLVYQATTALSFKTFALFSKYKAGIDAGIFKDDRDYNINNKMFTSGAGFIFKKAHFTINGNYQHNELSRHYLNDSIHKTSTWFEDNEYFGKSQFAELYGNANLGTGMILIAGIDYRYSDYNQRYFSVSSFGPYKPPPFPTTSLNQKAVYASVIFKLLNEKLNIEAGGRINKHSVYGTNSTFTFNPSYLFSEHARIFGSISSGFKAPSIFQVYDQYSGNKDLKAETSLNYEAGISLQNKKINTRLVLFDRKIDNGIDYNYSTFKYFNYIKQKVKGIELEANARLTNAISVNANYTWLSPKETNQNRATNKDTITYNYLLRRPAHNINFTVVVQPLPSLSFSISAKYVSSRYDVGGYLRPDIKLDSYFILNGYGEYIYNSNLKFFANLQNITNTKFFDIRGYNSIPFIINAGLSVNF
ncbi:MAG: hypothetical protein JWN76_553 [Chitinophagaceae bacterium]|nr:hypothetical protein [Chitinophagaceae bacterium]